MKPRPRSDGSLRRMVTLLDQMVLLERTLIGILALVGLLTLKAFLGG